MSLKLSLSRSYNPLNGGWFESTRSVRGVGVRTGGRRGLLSLLSRHLGQCAVTNRNVPHGPFITDSSNGRDKLRRVVTRTLHSRLAFCHRFSGMFYSTPESRACLPWLNICRLAREKTLSITVVGAVRFGCRDTIFFRPNHDALHHYLEIYR